MFMHSCVHSSFTHSLIHSFIHSFICSSFLLIISLFSHFLISFLSSFFLFLLLHFFTHVIRISCTYSHILTHTHAYVISVHLCLTPILFDSAVRILLKQNRRQDRSRTNPAHDPTTMSKNESLPVIKKWNEIKRGGMKIRIM